MRKDWLLYQNYIHCVCLSFFSLFKVIFPMFFFPELYSYEEQQYLFAPYEKERFLTKNRIQQRRYSGRHQNELSDCGTFLSSDRISMKTVKSLYIKRFFTLVNLPSLNAYHLLHSIKCIILHSGGLRIQMYFS